jgi:predicted permease
MTALLKQMLARFRAFFRSAKLDHELEDELASHASLLAEEYVAAGMSPEEAARKARIELGGVTQLREAHREARGLPFLDTLLQDLRYALRTLRRDAGFTTFAILIVGLGIGACSTIYSVVNALLIRPLPFSDPQSLAWVKNDAAEGDLSGQTVKALIYVDLRDASQSFSDMAAYYAFYGVGDQKLTGYGEPERLSGVPVSQNFFPLLGVQPHLGRNFTVEECQANQPVVLLSDSLWKRRFDSDPRIVGQKLILNDRPFTVAGVMPPSFDFASVFAPGSRTDLFLPLPLTKEVDRAGNTLFMIGRLKPGVTFAQAQAEASGLSEPINSRHDRSGDRFKVSSLETHVRGRLRPALFVLSCAVFVVMLIMCANLSNLQLARTATRRKEMAIRAALGAGRGRLVRQMLTESVVLSCCAAVLGLIVAFAGTRLVAHLEALSLPLRESVRIDVGALGFTVVIAVLTGLVFGLIPALHVPATGVHESLKDSSRGSSEGKSHTWLRGTLVVSEIAFACVLLVGAGLLIRSFVRVLDVDMGFHPERAGSIRVDPSNRFPTQDKRNAHYDDVLRRARDVPGIEAAGLTDVLPLGHNRSWSVGAKDQEYSRSHPPPDAFVRIISDGYLKAMGVPLRAGRDITERDNPSGKPVILVNETLARALWPGQDPIGRSVKYVDVEREVVGIVGDVRHIALEQGSGNEMYIPMRQTGDYSSVDLVVRSTLPPAGLASAVRAALIPIDPNLPGNEFRTLQLLVDRSVSPRRFIVLLLGGFALFALILASLGIYGVISYSVNQRTQEIGIRMALGASARELQGRIIVGTLKLAAIGMLIGVAFSWVLTRALSGLLFGITTTDPVTFLGMLAVLTLVAATAGYLPARRASRIDPMVALRAE